MFLHSLVPLKFNVTDVHIVQFQMPGIVNMYIIVFRVYIFIVGIVTLIIIITRVSI